jgi:hypothetical protein
MKVKALVYKPVGMVGGVIAGVVAGVLFRQVWRLASGGPEAPHATDRSRDWTEILAAAALEGAIFAIVKAAVNRGLADLLDKDQTAIR